MFFLKPFSAYYYEGALLDKNKPNGIFEGVKTLKFVQNKFYDSNHLYTFRRRAFYPTLDYKPCENEDRRI